MKLENLQGNPENNKKLEDLQHQLQKIVSNFKHLLPNQTTEQEHNLLSAATIELIKSEVELLEDEMLMSCEILIKIPKSLHICLEESIKQIEENLRLKSDIIFKWFPGCKVADIKICSHD